MAAEAVRRPYKDLRRGDVRLKRREPTSSCGLRRPRAVAGGKEGNDNICHGFGEKNWMRMGDGD